MKYYNLYFALQKYFNLHAYLRYWFYLSALLILYTNQLQAQIVLNGNFESRSACPSAYGMVSLATGWNTPTGSTTSPDYFNTCAPIASDLNVPYRLCDTLADFIFGDSAYTGVLFRDSLTSVFVSDWYEYITTQLSHPLWPAVNYRLSFLVANKRFANFNSNIGAIITRNVPSQAGRHPIPYPPLPTHQPSFNSDTEITSKTWQWLNFNFRTDTCDLHYLTIGRFYQDTLAIDTNPRPRPAICGGREHYCYYFIDGISIIGNEPSTALPNSIALCDSAKIAVDTGYFVGFQWYRNDTLLLGATRYNYYATIPGRYYVRLTLPICNSYVFSDTEIVYRPRDRMHLDFKSTSCSKSTLKVSFDGGITPIVVWNCPVATQPIDTNYSYSPRFLRYDTLNLVQLHIDYGSGCTFDTLLYIYPCCGTANTTGIDSLGVNRASLLLNYYDINHDGRLTGMELGMAYNQDGYLNIDTNITFDSVEIQMQVDAGIIINDRRTLTIKNSFLHACSNRMWNGIYVMDSTKSLYLTNNKIADAKEAVHTEQNGKIIIKDNIFDVNYKSIVIQNYWGTYMDTISHNQFLCQSITSYIPYTTLLAPYVGQRSYLGIAVNNVKSVTIGELGSTATRNKFDNLYNGIATFMSGGNIRNNEMISINNSTLDGKGISVKGDNSINAFNLSMQLGFDIANQNKLTNCNYGLELQGMAAEILYNDFNNNFQAIRFINTNSALLGGLKFNTRIHHNSIDTLKGTLTFDALGINTDQVYNSIKLIDNNTITNPSFSGSSDLMTKSVGILSNNSLSAGSGNYEAKDNVITNLRIGVRMLNGDSMYVHNNSISNSLAISSLNKFGINITNTIRSRFDCNSIGLSFASGTKDNCIGLQASPTNRVRKNLLSNGNMALRFNGDCTSDNNVWGNIMTNFNYYIVRSTAGKIGKQAQAGTDPLKLPGNKFLPSVSVPRLYSMNSSTDTVQTFRYNSLPIWAAYSTPASLSIRDSVTSRVIPVITSGLEPYTWAATDSSCIPMSYLVDSYGGDSSRTEMAMLIINSELIGTTEEITQNYEAKDFLYEDMITDSGKFVWNDTLHNFKTDYELSDAFQLKEAEKQLSTKDNETGISTLESTITPIEPMENMKEILMLQADNMPLDTGTEKFDAVEALAYSCPYSYGKAVYYARALLISRFGYLDFDDETLCMHADYSNCRRINPNPTMEDNKFDVVPNPLANSFAIQNNTDKLIQDIKIFDIIGRCILTTQAQNIDFSKYSSGRYFIEVQYTDQSKQVKLFIKE